MKIIKFILIIALVFTVIGGSAYYVVLRTRQEDQIASQMSNLQLLQPLAQATFAKAAESVPKIQIGNVLGAKDEIKTDGTSLPQKAFETARYTYCQQVVQDYERRYSSEAVPQTSPSPKPAEIP